MKTEIITRRQNTGAGVMQALVRAGGDLAKAAAILAAGSDGKPS